jgi:internalin A
LERPKVFISYAWGDDSSEEARQRAQVVESLCETAKVEGWEVVRDKNALRYGDLISTFMKILGQADLVIVVLSAKYLRSPYCMAELHALYRNARQEKKAFLDRIIPLVLGDARIGTPEERVEHAKHWEARYLKLRSDLDYLSVEDFRLYQDMKDWYSHVGGMLTHVNDVLHTHGFEAIVKENFAALRQMLQRARMEALSTRPGRQTTPEDFPKKEQQPPPSTDAFDRIPNAVITASPAPASSRTHIVVSALVPYLVNRIEQEREMRETLALHSESNSRRPILFLLYGRAEQAVNFYLERVQKSSIPRILRRMNYPDLLNWYDISWTRISQWQTNADRLIRSLRGDLEDKLELRPRSWPNSLVEAAAQKRITLIFCYRVRWEDWNAQHLEAIRLWAEDWASVPHLPPRYPTLVFFATEYQTIKLGIAKRLLGLDRRKDHPVHRQLRSLLSLDDPRMMVRLLPELANVTIDDIRDWIYNEVRPPNPAGLFRMATQILDYPELTTTGVPMEHLGERLYELLVQAAESQGVNT